MKYRAVLGLLLCGSLVSIAIAEPTELPQPVRHILDIRKVPHDSLSVFVQDVDSGEVVLSWHDDVPRNPASTMKLLTTLVALDRLGPTYRWVTDIFALGDIEDGRLEGDLLIRGGGDPFLVTERVWQMLRLVRQAGIHEIDGNLLLDDSYFDVPPYDPAEFDRQPLRAYNVGPNALLMNFKVVRYWFEPDHDRNAVRVWVDPPLENLKVENKLALSRGYCGGYQRGITITANEAIDKMIFSGRFPTGCKSYAMDRTALSHNEFAYGLFTSVWRESGGEFRGGWMKATAPDDVEPIVSFESLPLAEIIARVNKNSNNVMARHLLYTLSAEVLGAPGTESGGRKVVEDWLADTGIELPTLTLDNGAGLSREARVSAREFGALLELAWRKPYMPEYLASMAVSGLDGTLRRRFDDAALTGQAHLKTGSLDHVSAIAGYLQAKSGRRFAVVMLHNYENVHRGPGEEAQAALLRWLYGQ
ncbi:MAG TPA: D-alanyl-D-alanine carboxypeptidase/D-alanyl-D-alanine-endopeptidase [Woeseiaceae bacterium]|nr:D-alanyl-D-alanine carboxypeptidase/D-alanyl-D-alanine-endopeptidase [Woeseiaceae bacterium]